MPLNKKTGRSDRHTLTPGDLFKYRVGLLKNKKGKQRALEQQEKPEASGSGASPSTMLNALTLGSGSSYPNSAAASQSPLSATAPQSAAPSPATEAPAPTAFNPPAAASQSAAPSPATAAYSPPAFDPLAPATATQAPAISAATNLPAATAADPPSLPQLPTPPSLQLQTPPSPSPPSCFSTSCRLRGAMRRSLWCHRDNPHHLSSPLTPTYCEERASAISS